MNKPLHVVVIGAGMGGLAAAVDLAATGVRVTVLERADVPGGRMRELSVNGTAVDSGPTVFTMRWVFEQLFEHAGASLADELPLIRAERLARHVWTDGSELDLYTDVDRSADSISAFAGSDEAAAYRRFAGASEAIYDTLLDTFMRREKPGPVGLSLSLGLAGLPRLYATRPFASLWNELGRYFRDPRLRQLFARYATYCGSSPFRAPATLMLIAHVERAGVHYVEGGMQRLAQSLVRLAEQRGADFRFGCGVNEIRRRNGRAVGICTEEGEFVAADAVVFNGDVASLTRGLLGDDVRKSVAARGREPRSLSAVTWSLTASSMPDRLDYHTVFFGEDYPQEFRALFERRKVCDVPTVYVCAQDRHHGKRPSGDERLFVLVNAPGRPHLGREIDQIRSRVEAVLARGGLTLDLAGEHVVPFTPDDFDERFPGTDGAIYGWPTHGMLGSFRRSGSRARVRGLYLAGGSVHPGPGVPMAALSGRLAAAAVREDLGN